MTYMEYEFKYIFYLSPEIILIIFSIFIFVIIIIITVICVIKKCKHSQKQKLYESSTIEPLYPNNGSINNQLNQQDIHSSNPPYSQNELVFFEPQQQYNLPQQQYNHPQQQN